jgi:hypothetical protein
MGAAHRVEFANVCYWLLSTFGFGNRLPRARRLVVLFGNELWLVRWWDEQGDHAQG